MIHRQDARHFELADCCFNSRPRPTTKYFTSSSLPIASFWSSASHWVMVISSSLPLPTEVTIE
jgi:hypothetical protein